MPDTSPRLALPYIQPAQAQKHVTHNEALRVLDVATQLTVAAFDATTPPSLPVEGEIHALGAGATGDWAGHDGELAIHVDGYWEFHAPAPGWIATRAGTATLRVWSGTAWEPASADVLDNMTRLGIQTTADSTNRLAVASPATLLTHDGGDHRLKINKAAAGDTASLLFQSGWSGRAEIGLAGSDDLSFKVSADGTTWTSGLVIEAASGRVSAGALASGRIELAGATASLPASAVALCLYDTSLDSDGGAWRARGRGSSWRGEPLNTATRGPRADFPAVALVVAEPGKVTIHDAEDPALPMWRVQDFTGYTVTCVAAMQGKIVVGLASNGVVVLDFAADRLAVSPRYTTATTPALYANTINTLALAVLPGAPVDLTTGLSEPVIAAGVGTTGAGNGATCLIHPNGTVVDIAATGAAGGYACNDLAFTAGGALVTSQNYNGLYTILHVFDELPQADIAGSTNPAGSRTYLYNQDAMNLRASKANTPAINALVAGGDQIALGFADRLTLLRENPANRTAGLFAYVTSSFASGWLLGDARGAWLADTATTALVAAIPLADDGAASAGWTLGAGWTHDAANTEFDHAAGNTATLTRAVSGLTAGALYAARLTLANRTAGSVTAAIGGASASGLTTGGTVWFRATAATATLTVTPTSDFDGSVGGATVALADADRTVLGTGPVVVGSLARTPVAAGAGLVGYGGFSPADYLERPYSAALDFGTGDFCLMGWVKPAGSGYYVSRGLAGATNTLALRQIGGVLTATLAGTTLAGGSLPDGTWAHVALVRRAGTATLYANGRAVASAAAAGNVSEAGAVLRFGIETAGLANPFAGALTLWRASATAATAEQIAHVHAAEKALMQPNAACTLPGTSDNVLALAHDAGTGLLQVGTAAGRAAFDGLRRVDQTTTAVTTAIAAHGGLIGEQ